MPLDSPCENKIFSLGFSPLVISGSAHIQGNTMHTVQDMFGDVPTVHLCDLHIAPFSYTSRHEKDDFLPLVHRMLDHNPLIFATPVYWYTMSGRMKTLWDRMTDLLYHHRELVESLREKTCMIIASSAHGKPEGFEMPMEKTFAYLNMKYGGCWEYIFPLEDHGDYNAQQREKACLALKKLQESPSLARKTP